MEREIIVEVTQLKDRFRRVKIAASALVALLAMALILVHFITRQSSE